MKTTTCRCGFTLIETMIVVAILAIMAALATPSYVQYRRYSIRSACVSNLKSLESAIEQIKLSGKEDVSMVDICEPMGRLKSEPRCPADKSQPYDISGEMPLCRTPGPACRTCRGARGGGGGGTLPRGA